MKHTPEAAPNKEVPSQGKLDGAPDYATRCGAPQRELANWLTNEEWNASFFLGQEEYFRARLHCSVCEQVSVGMRRLARAGYRFRGLRLDRPDELVPRPGQPVTGEHESACSEMRAERFDSITRARVALPWIRENIPEVDPAWIEYLLRLYDRTHAGTL